VPAADGREWKYPGDENACPMIRDPMILPPRSMSCPFALSGNIAWASPVMTSG
jgi:hypothetical protein